MLCVRLNGVEAYAATNDLSAAGLQAALEQAERQAERIARHVLFDVRGLPPASGRSQYRSPNQDAPFPPSPSATNCSPRSPPRCRATSAW